MAASEAEIQAAIQLAIGALPGIRVFRNTTGTGWSGKHVETRGGLTVLRGARFTRYGLAPGSADLIGWRSLVVKPGHIGLVLAQLVSLEVKRPGEGPDPLQVTWLNRTREAGAAAAVVHSTAEVFEVLAPLGAES